MHFRFVAEHFFLTKGTELKNNMKVKQETMTEEALIERLKFYLNFGEIVNDEFPAKGASSWYPYGYCLMKKILEIASCLLVNKAGFEEIVLPSFVHGDDFMKECKSIKDFSERVYWSPLYRENDLHVVTPTIEAQLGSLYECWLKKGQRLPFKFFTVRGVGRYETGRTIPLWKERNVWPFFEGLTAHEQGKGFETVIRQQVDFMKSLFKSLGIPVYIIERPKISARLKEYSEQRIEAITVTPDKRVVILANVYNLGEIFSQVYNIFYSIKGTKHYVVTSAIGLSGRVLATLLVMNSDTGGFIIPPSLSPVLVSLVPIFDKPPLNIFTKKVKRLLLKEGISVKEFPATSSLGERRKKILAMGIPFLIELGENEKKSLVVRVKLRDGWPSVETVLSELPQVIKAESRKLEKRIKLTAQEQFLERNRTANSTDELKKFTRNELLVKAPFCNEPNCYLKTQKAVGKEIVGSEYKVKPGKEIKCIGCGKPAEQNLYFGIKWKGEK